jgi:lysozyme
MIWFLSWFRPTTIAKWLVIAVPLVGTFEGLRLVAYRDPVGIPTICFGETQGVALGQKKTRAECDALLSSRLQEFDRELAKCLPALPALPPQTRAALVSWAYNVGSRAACASTLVRKANANDFVGACNELPRWNKITNAYGQRIILPGLTRRRAEERALCLEGLATR